MATLAFTASSTISPWAVQRRLSAMDARLALAGLTMPEQADTLKYRGGVFPHGDHGGYTHNALRIHPAPAGGMKTAATVGNAQIDTASNGPYLGGLRDLSTLDHPASSSTTNRMDLVIARVVDDQNSALGGAPEDREFKIQVWQGTGTSGTPALDYSGLPSAGWIPLAGVRVMKNQTTIVAADITDLRGPGLATRGGLRALYGADALQTSAAYQAPGAYPGDHRWVQGNGFQDQVWYGQLDGWRGVHNRLVYDVPAYNPNQFLWFKGTNARRVFAEVALPYPGSPYMIEATARIMTLHGPNVSVDYRIKINDDDGQVVNWTREHTFGATLDRQVVVTVPSWDRGTYYGPVDVTLDGIVRDTPSSGYGFGIDTALMANTRMQVRLLPATVAPRNGPS